MIHLFQLFIYRFRSFFLFSVPSYFRRPSSGEAADMLVCCLNNKETVTTLAGGEEGWSVRWVILNGLPERQETSLVKNNPKVQNHVRPASIYGNICVTGQGELTNPARRFTGSVRVCQCGALTGGGGGGGASCWRHPGRAHRLIPAAQVKSETNTLHTL